MKKSNRDNWNNAEKSHLPKLQFNSDLFQKWAAAGRLTRSIVIVCAIVFLIQIIYPAIYSLLKYYHAIDSSLVIQEPWRLITPAFMHGNFVHIAFNLVMWWLIAQQIEKVRGVVELSVIVIISAMLSNFCQFYFTGPEFLGLSGVVFAIGGYCLSYAYFAKEQALELSQSLMFMLFVSLLIGFLFGGALSIGNAAHVSGLVTGLILGFIQAKI